MNKKTILIGASTKDYRDSYRTALLLQKKNHDVVLFGKQEGNINGMPISTTKNPVSDVDTITLYLNSENQKDWYDYILATKPKRVIFNPGAENEDLMKKLCENNIEGIEACTQVMLSIGNY
jgi:hypothetical protein